MVNKCMKFNKSPGLDGLPVEFYKNSKSYKRFNFGNYFLKWVKYFIENLKLSLKIMDCFQINLSYLEVFSRDGHFWPCYLLSLLTY